MIIEPDYLLNAYRNGYFPMAEPDDGEIYWYSPDPRAIINLDKFHIPKTLMKTLNKNEFSFRINSNFERVIKECSKRDETWISDDIIESYVNLYNLGFAFSFEAYSNNKLAGGLYGVGINSAFFGESMFHIVRDASKAALVVLVQTLKKCGYTLLDTQYITPHLQKFGAEEIPRNEYLKRLKIAIEKPVLKFQLNG